MTADLLAEIKQLLGMSNIRHGMAFRAIQRGLTAEQIAAQWGRSISHAQNIVRSVQLLLEGDLPTGAGMAYTNSFAYRELWELGASPALLAYVKARLRELVALNPEVKMAPMGPVFFPDELPVRKPERAATYCSECFLSLPCDCD